MCAEHDGGEGLAKRKGVIARRGLDEGTEVGVARVASEPSAIELGASMEMVIEPGTVKQALA